MENYFNYFTEIEERFQQRRGNLLLLSTLDWALIESWKDAGLPLEAVLRGIDAAFDRYDRRPATSKTRKINSLAWCAQAVMAEAEQISDAGAGSSPQMRAEDTGERERVAAYLEANAANFSKAREAISREGSASLVALLNEYAAKLQELAGQMRGDHPNEPEFVGDPGEQAPGLEDLERRLTVMEEKLFALLTASSPDDLLVDTRAHAERELAPYRGKMTAPQIEQLLKQCIHRRLLDHFGLKRLSLFYM